MPARPGRRGTNSRAERVSASWTTSMAGRVRPPDGAGRSASRRLRLLRPERALEVVLGELAGDRALGRVAVEGGAEDAREGGADGRERSEREDADDRAEDRGDHREEDDAQEDRD